MKTQVMIQTTSKGQMTLPKAARIQLGIKPGDTVAVVISDAGVSVERPPTLSEIWRLTKTKTTWPGDQAADNLIAQTVADNHAQP